MAITGTRVIKWGGSASGEGPISAKPTYTLVHKVDTDSPLDGPQVIFDYFRSNVVWFGSPYSHGNDFDNTATCNSIVPEMVDKSGGQWTVTVTYTNPQADGGGGGGTDLGGNLVDDPTLFHDEIEVSHMQVSVPVWAAYYVGGFRGRAGGMVAPGDKRMPCNSAFQPFDPGLENIVNIKVVRITKNRSAYTSQFDGFLNTVNSDQVVINKPQYRYSDVWEHFCAKIVSHESRFLIHKNFPYWKESVEVHIHPDSWNIYVADMGLEARAMDADPDGQGGFISAQDLKQGMPHVRRLLDPDGNPVSTPVPLDGDGQPRKPGEPTVWITWLPNEVRPFSAIAW